jgi:phage-related protein
MLQQGHTVGMPRAEPLPIVGPRCGALRVRDESHSWRIVYRVDPDVVLILEVYAKKTRAIPPEVISRCRKRLKYYDDIAKKKGPPGN